MPVSLDLNLLQDWCGWPKVLQEGAWAADGWQTAGFWLAPPPGLGGAEHAEALVKPCKGQGRCAERHKVNASSAGPAVLLLWEDVEELRKWWRRKAGLQEVAKRLANKVTKAAGLSPLIKETVWRRWREYINAYNLSMQIVGPKLVAVTTAFIKLLALQSRRDQDLTDTQKFAWPLFVANLEGALREEVMGGGITSVRLVQVTDEHIVLQFTNTEKDVRLHLYRKMTKKALIVQMILE